MEPPRRLTPPRLRPGIVLRPRLSRALDGGGEASLTLVAAPAGYGKTVAVETWLAERGHAVAWVRTDARDDDPVRLWASVGVAVERARPGAGSDALDRAAGPSGVVEPAIDALASALAADERRIVIVLEDLQSITEARCLRSIDHAIAAFPEHAQLVLLSRGVPALRLARLRALGQLVDLRTRELAFTVAETQAMFAAIEGVSADAAAAATLTARTEGWAAVLYLAALWMRERGDPADAVRTFRGSQRLVAEYIADEALSTLDAGSRRFLERTSVLSHMCGELCDAALRQTRSSARLQALERANLLVIPLADRPGWYRYHALLRDHLLSRIDPREADSVRRHALAWSREHGLPEDAAEYAGAVGDVGALLDIVEAHSLDLMRKGRSRTLFRWVAGIPRPELIARPKALVAGIGAAHLAGRPAPEIRRLLSVARGADPTPASSFEGALLQIAAALYTDDDVGEALRAAQLAVELSRADDELLVPALAVLALVRLVAGDEAQAAETASLALGHPDAAQRTYGHVAEAVLAILDARAGRRHLAREHADRALAVARESGLARGPAGAPSALADAIAAAAEGRLHHAWRAARQAAATTIAGGVWQAWALLELARVELLRGRLLVAEDAFAHACELLDAATDAGALPALADGLRSELDAARAGEQRRPIEPLSAAELAVLQRLPGLTVRELAEVLYLSPNTIKSHIRAIYRKLDVGTREDAVARATGLGLLGEAGSANSPG